MKSNIEFAFNNLVCNWYTWSLFFSTSVLIFPIPHLSWQGLMSVFCSVPCAVAPQQDQVWGFRSLSLCSGLTLPDAQGGTAALSQVSGCGTGVSHWGQACKCLSGQVMPSLSHCHLPHGWHMLWSHPTYRTTGFVLWCPGPLVIFRKQKLTHFFPFPFIKCVFFAPDTLESLPLKLQNSPDLFWQPARPLPCFPPPEPLPLPLPLYVLLLCRDFWESFCHPSSLSPLIPPSSEDPGDQAATPASSGPTLPGD